MPSRVFAAAVCILLLGSLSTTEATPLSLRLRAGLDAIEIIDNGPGDLWPKHGRISFDGQVSGWRIFARAWAWSRYTGLSVAGNWSGGAPPPLTALASKDSMPWGDRMQGNACGGGYPLNVGAVHIESSWDANVFGEANRIDAWDFNKPGCDFKLSLLDDMPRRPFALTHRVMLEPESAAGILSGSLYINVLPEPAALTLLTVGLVGLAFLRARRIGDTPPSD